MIKGIRASVLFIFGTFDTYLFEQLLAQMNCKLGQTKNILLTMLTHCTWVYSTANFHKPC